jgi:hypothetical protein
VIRAQENRNISQPASNAVMEYWGKLKMKIERTDNPSIRDIILENHPTKKNLPIRVSTKLTDSGFN